MSFKSLQENNLVSKTMTEFGDNAPWVRNPDWPSLPSITASEEKIVGLYAVYPDSPFFAIIMAVNSGTYTVDFGDGTSTNTASGGQTNYLYDYNNVNLYSNPNLPYKIAIVTITPTTPGSTLTTINLTVRHTSTTVSYGDGWLDLSIAASASTINIGVQTPIYHAFLEQVRILRHRATSLSGILRDCYNLQNVVEITPDTGINVTSTNAMFSGCNKLSNIPLLNTNSVTDMNNMFFDCINLTSIPLFNTSAVTTMTAMFQNCVNLKAIPLLNTSNVTNMSNMFNGCGKLIMIPLIDTIKVSLFNSMFSGCRILKTIPLLNTSNGTSMSSMFSTCTDLLTIPLLDTIKVNSMTTMFNNCSSLQTVPLLNTSNVTLMTTMFASCISLRTVPLFDTSNVTDMTSMFTGCTNLTTLPTFNTSNLTSINTMVGSACRNLQQIPAFNLQKVSNATNMASFASLASVSKISFTNAYYSFSVASCKLSGTALNEVYTNLPTVPAQGTAITFQDTGDTVTLVNHGYLNLRTIRFTTITTTTGISINTDYFVRNATTDTFQLSTTATGAIINLVNNGNGTISGQTITVTSNWGTGTDDPTIATGKGWTVTGS